MVRATWWRNVTSGVCHPAILRRTAGQCLRQDNVARIAYFVATMIPRGLGGASKTGNFPPPIQISMETGGLFSYLNDSPSKFYLLTNALNFAGDAILSCWQHCPVALCTLNLQYLWISSRGWVVRMEARTA